MKALLHYFLFFFCTTLFAQVKFEKGHFIDQNNNKIECLIKNYDWLSLPYQIEYKASESAEKEVIQVTHLNAFQIYETEHYYKRFSFQIDKNTEIEAERYTTQTGFMKVLVEGKANLYEYERNFYFYETDGQQLKQLKYKKFINAESRKQEDFSYRTELFTVLKCNEKASQTLRKVGYQQKDLAGFFEQYNECQKAEYINFTKKKTKSEFRLKAIAGVNFYTLTRELKVSNRKVDLENQATNFIIGFETEVLLPFNRKKWALFAAPNYQNQKQDSRQEVDRMWGGYSGVLTAEHNYSYIEIPIGLRHYFFLNVKSKIFVDAAFGFMFELSSTENVKFIEKPAFPSLSFKEENKNRTSYRIGLGYNYNNKYALSVNYYPMKNVLQSNIDGAIAITMGYRLF